MKKRYLVIPVLLLFVVVLALGSFSTAATAGQPPQPSPPVGQIIFYGPNAADVLMQGYDFAQGCSCYVYGGMLETSNTEMARMTLNYTAGGQSGN